MSEEEVVAAAKGRIEELLAPVNGGVGEDISYDEKFEEIKAEADKLQSLAGESVNWGNISSLSEELLTEKSKDFRLACYWAAAKAQENTLDALLDVTVLISEFTRQFWDEGYPPLRRIRARAGILGWMSDRCANAREIKLSAKDQEKVKAFDELTKALDADFREKMADSYPGISELREAARHMLRTCPKEQAPPPKPEPPKPAAPAAAPAPPGAAPPPPVPVAAVAPAG
ncbi:MAG: type VI secretion system ImpA family N-terminal domain-containing protein, partial [Deltaproteobacteria bacterium]|nr:type VI secretion system ImpA family N-terminal domain-containing protein [Deltaproteobacteria bacterium]MBW2537807.1 type VI secretion system ImpA family N-terminal domain-containing protein [Deltaproteobacteria bacterium]